jgi:hypothetical protein
MLQVGCPVLGLLGLVMYLIKIGRGGGGGGGYSIGSW